METETTTTETENSSIASIATVGIAITAGAATLYALKRRYDRKRDEKHLAIMMEAFTQVYLNQDDETPTPSES